MKEIRARLLVVEDNLETQLIIKVALRDNYDVHMVNNASDAITLLSNNNFNLVLLDLNLNGKGDGKSILNEIRNKMNNHHLPVIIITAYELKAEDEKFFEKNANVIIPKPFDKLTLLETVNKTLSIK